MVLIVASLLEMRQDVMRIGTSYPIFHTHHEDSKIRVFDKVLLENNRIAVVESISKDKYCVVFQDKMGNIIHETLTKDKIQKVTIILYSRDINRLNK